MKHSKSLLVFLLCSVPLMSFNDFIDYWTVKFNGKIVYDSNNDKKEGFNKFYNYQGQANNVSTKDTVEIQYFTDTPCTCICNFFITEYSNDGTEILGTYLKEQKAYTSRPYKIALDDILNCGQKGTIKAVFYYENMNDPRELCRFEFK